MNDFQRGLIDGDNDARMALEGPGKVPVRDITGESEAYQDGFYDAFRRAIQSDSMGVTTPN